MKIKEGYLLKQVAGSNVVVPVDNIDFDGLITLNESGALLWKKLENDCEFSDLMDTLLNEYEISDETASNDILTFLNILRNEDILDE